MPVTFKICMTEGSGLKIVYNNDEGLAGRRAEDILPGTYDSIRHAQWMVNAIKRCVLTDFFKRRAATDALEADTLSPMLGGDRRQSK